MTYRIDLTLRAERDLRRLYDRIGANEARQARLWFLELEKRIFSLEDNPLRGAGIPEDAGLRQLLFGKKRDVYRVIYAVDTERRIVSVLHIRHSAQSSFRPEDEF